MFLAEFKTVATIWKPPQCPWMNLESIMLIEISQTEKDKS